MANGSRIDAKTLELLWHDADARDVQLRRVVTQRMADSPPPQIGDCIVASYFLALRTLRLQAAAAEIAYHATSGVRNPPPGSLLEQCTAKAAGVDPFDAGGRIGLLHVAFPLKLMLQPDGHLTSCDLLHTVAGAVIFDMYENQDARLVALEIPEPVLRTFPGPAYGPQELRRRTGFAADEPAFGTILKPTAGITPDEVGALVADAAECQLFLFVKEDEDLYPHLDYSPVAERTRRAVEAIDRAQQRRGGKGLLFAPHVSGAPHEILDTVHSVVEAGATAVMFSETFAGGSVRMVREATRSLPCPPAIYGHNAGIGVKIARHLPRGDRPARPARRHRFPPDRSGSTGYALHPSLWRRMARQRSGALPRNPRNSPDDDRPRRRAGPGQLAAQPGRRPRARAFAVDPALGRVGDQLDPRRIGQTRPAARRQAMREALEVHRSGEVRGVAVDEHLRALAAVAERRQMKALREALRQRYPDRLG